jgi:hypothetical protein
VNLQSTHDAVTHMDGSDSRYIKLISVVDGIIREVELGRLEMVEQELQGLLKNSIELMEAENYYMSGLCYDGYLAHSYDHLRLCRKIGTLCFKWHRCLCSVDELLNLRSGLHVHFSRYDLALEHYLVTGEVPLQVAER